MANRRYIGAAKAVAQLETITVTGPVVIGETWTVTINNKAITFTAAAATTADVAAGLVALLNASTIAEFAEVTWADADPDITGTADVTDYPFTISVSTDSVGGSIATVTTTSATGPKNWDDANNWDTGAVPAATDAVYIDNTANAASITYGLDQNAVTVASITINAPQFKLGLPNTNGNGYPEYRDSYLKIGCTTFNLHNAAGRVKVDFNAVNTTINVFGTGSAAESGIEAFLFKNTGATTTVEVSKGTVGGAVFGAEAATITTYRQTGGTVRLSAGVTLSGCDLDVTGGTLTTNTEWQSLELSGGEAICYGAFTAGDLDVRGSGKCRFNGSGTVATVDVFSPDGVDCSGDLTARTFTTTTLHPNGSLFDPHGTITHTNNVAKASNVQRVSAA